MIRPSASTAWGLILVIAAAAAACRHDAANMTELQRVKSGELDVVLLSTRDVLRHGKDAFTIEFQATSDKRLVDVGNVRARANMPMAGMPMLGSIDVQRTSVPGRYGANSELEMAGTWRLTAEWEGPAGRGSITFAATVQ